MMRRIPESAESEMHSASRRRRHPWTAVSSLSTVLTVAAVVATVATVSATTSGRAHAEVPGATVGWTTVWSDDFAGGAGTGVNTGNWLYDTGTSYAGGAAHWGTGEVETMTSSTANVSQDGAGHLAITPIRDAGGAWTSGRIETTRTDFTAPEGGIMRVQASIQQANVTSANGLGYWPAAWMLGADARPAAAKNWPGIGEIDMMEDVNGRSSEMATLHCGVSPDGACHEKSGLGSGERPCGGCQTGFHTYAVELDRSANPEQLRWYLDNNLIHTVKADQVDQTTWANATHHGFFLIFNVAIGGEFPNALPPTGPTDQTASGQPMLVDYVAVYQKAAGGR
jgi:Glycosyl hydrolases family 16